MVHAIEVENLTKKFGDFVAVDNISFNVEQGEIFGFLGPNGAGKTTTTRMLTGISTPTAGTARIMGHDIRNQAFQAKELMGVVTDLSNVYNELSAWDNLIFTAKLYGIPRGQRGERAEELLEMFGLSDVKNQDVAEFSGGMKRRLTIAMALINEAKVLFLDEPTAALDVQSVRTIRNLIYQLNEEGTTIFLTTHNMAEASELCDRIAIINQGEIGIIDSPERLKQTIERTHSIEVTLTESSREIIQGLERLNSVRNAKKHGDKLRLYTDTPTDTISDVFQFSQERKIGILSINTLSPSLEDVFLELTGEKIVERPKKGGAGKQKGKMR